MGRSVATRLPEEVPLRRHDEVAGPALACERAPADDRAGNTIRLPHHELGRPGDLVRDRDRRRVELVAHTVADAAQVDEDPEPGGADRDVSRPLPPRPAEGIGDEDGDVPAGELPQP